MKNTDNLIHVGTKKKVAFVCSGGASKAGAFHLGVALALQEQGFKFLGGLNKQKGSSGSNEPEPLEISTYVGSSAGSIICSYLAAGYSLDNIFHSFLGKGREPDHTADPSPRELPRLTYQKMFKLRTTSITDQIGQLRKFHKLFAVLMDSNWDDFLHLDWLKLSGIFSTSGLEQYLREEVLASNSFHDYVADLFIVATQLNHSRKVVFGKHSFQPPPHDLTCQYDNDVAISDACAASTALPVIFSPYPIKNRNGQLYHYIDGEIRDTLSTHVATDNGADLVIASYTHQPYHMTQEIGSLTEQGLPAIVIQSIYLLIEQKINNHIYHNETQRNAFEAVSSYCKKEGIPDRQRHEICAILEKELHHRLSVDTIYIHPKPGDTQLFFGEHFTLSPKKMTAIVKCGFRSAIDILRKYHFADRKPKQAMGTTLFRHSAPN